MKFSVAVALVVTSADVAAGFSAAPLSATRRSSALSADKVGVYYSTSTGNTETVAGYISKFAGVECEEIGDAKSEDLEAHESIIVGAPTWHTGADEERSGTTWDDWLYKTLPSLNLSGKKVAVFGCGDQESYGDYYCDAAGELHDCFVKAGCKVFGQTSTDGYSHASSKAEIEPGTFCGLMFDEDNQYDISEERAKKWIAQLKEEGFM